MKAIDLLAQQLSHLEVPDAFTLWHGIDEASRSLMLQTMVARRPERDILVLCDTEKTMRQRGQELAAVLPGHDVVPFPHNELIAFEVLAQSDEVAMQRASLLNRLCQPHAPVAVLTTADTLVQSLLPRSVYGGQARRLQVGDIVDFDGLRAFLVDVGYRMERTVYSPGQVSIHGGIVDVFVPGQARPVRIEFFDDEIDSIRTFDEENQRSLAAVDQVLLQPAREYFIPGSMREQVRSHLESALSQEMAALEKEGKANKDLVQVGQGLLEALAQGEADDRLPQFAPYLGLGQASFLAYMEGAQIYIDDLNRLEDALAQGEASREAHFTSLLQAGQVLPGQKKAYLAPKRLAKDLQAARPQAFTLLKKAPGFLTPETYASYPVEAVGEEGMNLQALIDQVRLWAQEAYDLLVVAPDETSMAAFDDLLDTYGLKDAFRTDPKADPPRIFASVEPASPGAVFHRDRTVFLSLSQLFRKARPARRKKTQEDGAESLSGPEDLEPGDYVVHTHHGIGIYKGTRHVKTGDMEKDYLLVQYAGTDKLYVPMDQFNLLQRYRRDDGKKPRLHKLSGGDWQRTKSRVRSSVKKLAEDLLDIQARRKSRPGFAFSPDGSLMADFEAAFPYVETPDQLKAIEDVKADMEASVPMDRLICGDVGYGKTEVAIRAAFKAVLDGKQVGVLVPTTILAQQHLQSFQARMADFGVEVVALSRFTTGQEEKDILRGLREGTIDVVIGTHKLLNKKVVLRDLGLLIIDEEQRFGVSHKERIKDIRSQVDVLTLTATPIPRTLHMSLVGLRDMSLIDTPPEDRYPIQTYVVENQPLIIEQAIRKELAREGQVFVVYNRVQDMDRVLAYYRDLLPEARIATAHGQMAKGDLEKVILSFMDGEADILLSTTIIETGVDMPNVNTMIVHSADRFGLAQLYQLRGRIGRSDRVAYAYLTYEPQQMMTELAEKRLQTLKSYTALGSGYQIAMKDLEFRGAGSLLGADQHGNLLDVGFDLYMHMLESAVNDLQGESPEVVREKPEMDFHVQAYIPEKTIPDQALRLHIYQKLDACQSFEELRDLTDEFIDRFGDLPDPAWALFLLMEIRLLASFIGIRSLKQVQDSIQISFSPEVEVGIAPLRALLKEFPRRLTLSNRSGELKLVWALDRQEDDNKSLDSMKVVLDRLWRLARQQ